MYVSELIQHLQFRLNEGEDSHVLIPDGIAAWRPVHICQSRMVFSLGGDSFVALQDAGDRLSEGEAVIAMTLDRSRTLADNRCSTPAVGDLAVACR